LGSRRDLLPELVLVEAFATQITILFGVNSRGFVLKIVPRDGKFVV